MAEFLTRLWESIFTPGPTPTLLVATNATFACLQLLLLTLLIATYSVHFVVLSFISGGLWWAINWFAREIAEAQKKEEEAKRIRGVRRREREKEGSPGQGSGATAGAADRPKVEGTAGGEGEGMDSGDDTETEIEQSGHLPPKPVPTLGTGGAGKQQKLGGPQGPGASASGLAPRDDEALKKRRSIGESEAMSTDSEWEKVSEGER